jgi:hypothetical protein
MAFLLCVSGLEGAISSLFFFFFFWYQARQAATMQTPEGQLPRQELHGFANAWTPPGGGSTTGNPPPSPAAAAAVGPSFAMPTGAPHAAPTHIGIVQPSIGAPMANFPVPNFNAQQSALVGSSSRGSLPESLRVPYSSMPSLKHHLTPLFPNTIFFFFSFRTRCDKSEAAVCAKLDKLLWRRSFIQ